MLSRHPVLGVMPPIPQPHHVMRKMNKEETKEIVHKSVSATRRQAASPKQVEVSPELESPEATKPGCNNWHRSQYEQETAPSLHEVSVI